MEVISPGSLSLSWSPNHILLKAVGFLSTPDSGLLVPSLSMRQVFNTFRLQHGPAHSTFHPHPHLCRRGWVVCQAPLDLSSFLLMPGAHGTTCELIIVGVIS